MLRKIAIAGGMVGVLVVSLALALPQPEPSPAIMIPVETPVDVIMPTKSSRPGCEEEDRCYIPPVITIAPGQSVSWENQDAAFHSVTSGAYGETDGLFDSGYMDPGQQFQMTFHETGTFRYHCTLHPWMLGVVEVR